MATTPKKLFDAQQIGTTITTYYTGVSDTTAIVKHLLFDNTSTSTITVTVYIVGSGDSADTTNRCFNRAIPAGKNHAVFDLLNATINTGDTLQMVASAAGLVGHGSCNEVT